MFLSASYTDGTKKITQFYVGYDVIKKRAFATTNINFAMPFHFMPSYEQTLMIPGHPQNNASSCFATILEEGKVSILENTIFCVDLSLKSGNYILVNIPNDIHDHPPEKAILPFVITEPTTHLTKLFADGIVFTNFQLDINALHFARKFAHDLQDMRRHEINHIPEMMKLIGDPQIREFVKSVYHGMTSLEDKCHLATYSSVNLRNHNEQEGWHVDWPYHTLQEPFPMDTLGLQCMILLDDFTEENGATYFCRGSHTTRVHVRGGFENERLLAKKGTVVFWLGKMWHCGGKNTTDKDRAALLANFSQISVPAKHNMVDNLAKGEFGFEAKEGKLVVL